MPTQNPLLKLYKPRALKWDFTVLGLTAVIQIGPMSCSAPTFVLKKKKALFFPACSVFSIKVGCLYLHFFLMTLRLYESTRHITVSGSNCLSTSTDYHYTLKLFSN